jgi:flagellar hook-basal body complex protein FliE
MITQQLLLDSFEYKDGNLYWKIAKPKTVIGKFAGSKLSNGYLHVQLNRKFILHHRAIFLMHYGYLPKFIDHIDGNRSNNKIENLREATKAQNNWNQKYKGSVSGFKGVTWNKQDKKWQPQIRANNKKFYLGKFENLSDAIIAYQKAAKKLHGEYRTNTLKLQDGELT